MVSLLLLPKHGHLPPPDLLGFCRAASAGRHLDRRLNRNRPALRLLPQPDFDIALSEPDQAAQPEERRQIPTCADAVVDCLLREFQHNGKGFRRKECFHRYGYTVRNHMTAYGIATDLPRPT